MKKNLLCFKMILTILLVSITNVIYAQDLSEQYMITIWNKDLKGNYVEQHLQTVGFLPVFTNTKDEIIIGSTKLMYQSFLNIQIIESKENKIKVLIDFKNDNKNYKEEILINNKEVKDMKDFKIEVEKK